MPSAPDPAPDHDPRPAVPASLHSETRGTGPRVLMAHGFTQTGRVWGSMDENLTRDHQIVLVDMPGHGASSGVSSTLVDGALQLARVGGRATYLGYSMGARFCLHLALACPAAVDGLVLISGTAGIDDRSERLERQRADAAMASELDPLEDRAEVLPVETFLGRWMSAPMFAGVGPEADGLDERRRNTGPGLASSLRRAGTGTQLPLWDKVDRLTMPVLVVTGGLDEKFTALGRRMADAIGANASHVVVPGTGHAPHLQRPDTVAELVRGFVGSAATDRT
jgi:2-succinyl-6-hydroxy-2,4-cyclohexadiene-1-carboxylate synthase